MASAISMLVGSAKEIASQGINASISSIEIIGVLAEGYSTKSFLNGKGLEEDGSVVRMVLKNSKR